MLSKAKRLNSTDVRRILKEGRRTSSPPFSLCADFKKGEKRYAIVVSSKITGSKVKRNRIRRRIYNSLHSIFNLLRTGEGVVFVLSDISSFSSREIQEKITGLFTKAGMLPSPKED